MDKNEYVIRKLAAENTELQIKVAEMEFNAFALDEQLVQAKGELEEIRETVKAPGKDEANGNKDK